jgi:methanogenic corrinoid protein MtbC1
MPSPPEAIPLAGGILGRRRHICALFDGRDEEYGVLLPFVKEGLERGEKAVHIVDPALREDHLARLAAAGIAVARAQSRRQLEVPDWGSTYLQGGSFDRRAMAALVERMLTRARAEGFPRMRVVAHMEWALDDRCDVRALVEYEATMTGVLARYDDPAVCTYDRTRFSACTAMDVLRAHERMILDGVLQDNVAFLPRGALLPRVRGSAVGVLRDRYLTALATGACREAFEIAVEEALWQGVDVPSLYVDVVQPAQYEIGRLWREGRIGVAREHLATEVSRAVLAHLRPLLPCRAGNGLRAVVACVEGERHDLGARMVADFLAMAGFDVHFLGADVPTAGLADFVRARPPDLLALAATTAAHAEALRGAVGAVRRVMGDGIRIAAGGQVLLRSPALRDQLGLDLYADDARALVAVAHRAVGH